MQQPRQMYGLGSLVKKAVRGVKKIAKSPLGKAALLAGGAYFAPSLWGGAKGLAGWKGLASKFGPSIMGNTSGGGGFFSKGLGRFLNPWSGAFGEAGKFSGKHAFGLASAAALAAPFLMKGEEEEEIIEEPWSQVPSSIADIRNQAKNYYKVGSAGSNLDFMPGGEFVDKNWYAADGGRVGLMYGGNPNEERSHSLAGTHVGENLARGDGNNTVVDNVVVDDTVTTQNLPSDNLMAGLTKKQIQMLNTSQRNLKNIMGTSDEEILGNIKGKDNVWDDPNDPATLEDVQKYYSGTYVGAQGGRVGLLNGGGAGQEQIEQMLMAEFVKYKNQGGTLTFEQFVQAVMQQQQEQQGGMEQPQEVAMAAKGGLMGEDEDEYNYNPQAAMRMYKRPGKQEGGIMETEVADEMIDMGGQEKDYRETGGFVELGGKERADDVPARLSKNEFVFTADAVRAAGGGDIDAGSEVMQNMMDNLEAGGEISEESQGLEGAQAMYDQQQMLQSRIA